MVHITDSTTIDAPAELVFEIIADPKHTVRWVPSAITMRQADGNPDSLSAGTTYAVTYDGLGGMRAQELVVEHAPPLMYRTVSTFRHLRDETEWRVVPVTDETCELHVASQLDGRTTRGRMMAAMSNRSSRKHARASLERIRDYAESQADGEERELQPPSRSSSPVRRVALITTLMVALVAAIVVLPGLREIGRGADTAPNAMEAFADAVNDNSINDAEQMFHPDFDTIQLWTMLRSEIDPTGCVRPGALHSGASGDQQIGTLAVYDDCAGTVRQAPSLWVNMRLERELPEAVGAKLLQADERWYITGFGQTNGHVSPPRDRAEDAA